MIGVDSDCSPIQTEVIDGPHHSKCPQLREGVIPFWSGQCMAGISHWASLPVKALGQDCSQAVDASICLQNKILVKSWVGQHSVWSSEHQRPLDSVWVSIEIVHLCLSADAGFCEFHKVGGLIFDNRMQCPEIVSHHEHPWGSGLQLLGHFPTDSEW